MTPRSGRGPVTRWFDGWMRSFTYYRTGRRGRPTPTSLFEQPEPDERVERAMRATGWVLAVVAPLLVCLVLVALRDGIDRSTATLVLILPIVLVAVLGGPAPATLAAIVAPVTFDVLLTEPYYRLEINAAEDVEATLILLVVGTLVGQLVARETRARVQSHARRSEVAALLAAVDASARSRTEADLVERTTGALTDLLDLRDCRWAPGYHGAAHPLLGRDGEIADADDSTPDRAPLPSLGVEVPVVARGGELGRLILVPSGDAPVSREERGVAVAVADIFGLALADLRGDQVRDLGD